MTFQRWMTLTAILRVSVPAAYRFPQRVHPFQKGRPSDLCWGRSIQWEIRHPSTNYIRKTPRSIIVLGYVLYKKKKVFCHEQHMNYFIMIVTVKWSGWGRGNWRCETKMNLIFLRRQDKICCLLPIRLNEILKISTLLKNTRCMKTGAWIPFPKHTRTDINNFHW